MINRLFVNGVYVIIIFQLLGCKDKEREVMTYEIEDVIEHLTSIEKKRLFLEKVYEDDQNVRSSETLQDIITNHGNNSPEHIAYTKKQNKQDHINLEKIERYLNKFGHPDKASFSENAVLVPWIVIHHSTTYEVRERNFKYLYKAYKKGDLSVNRLSFFLDRMYRIKFGERLDMGSSYKEVDKITLIINTLNIEE